MTIYVSSDLEYAVTDEPQYYASTVWLNKAPFKVLTAELFSQLEKYIDGLDRDSVMRQRFAEIKNLYRGKE